MSSVVIFHSAAMIVVAVTETASPAAVLVNLPPDLLLLLLLVTTFFCSFCQYDEFFSSEIRPFRLLKPVNDAGFITTEKKTHIAGIRVEGLPTEDNGFVGYRLASPRFSSSSGYFTAQLALMANMCGVVYQ
ncbi:unnamed protein product [Gongylonema pulchrum]|uniref:Dirigent protein n=1 Tax=Gongylonema pulchrum TaxID=637853 RepID=A0A183D0D1_9BILA|nr:unnamed protein product [Gongylonema pulchrum]